MSLSKNSKDALRDVFESVETIAANRVISRAEYREFLEEIQSEIEFRLEALREDEDHERKM
jgi:hypothetical protein